MSRHALDTRQRTGAVHLTAPIERRRDGGQRWEPSGFRTQVALLAGRSLRTAFSDYRLVFFGLLQPVVLLLLFSQVFKEIGTLPGVVRYHGYINFLMPATLVNIAMTTAMSSGVGVLTEIHTGFVDRLRAMPINLMSVLVARTLSDAVRLAAQQVVAVVAAVAFLGFRPVGVFAAVVAVGLTVFVGWGLGWLFVAIATWQRKPETMQALSFVVMFPLMFGSSAYMPIQAMPVWLRVFSRVNPLTYAIDATRALTIGLPAAGALAATIGLVLAAAACGVFASSRSFRRTA